MAFEILLFAVGLLLLIKGGDWFVDSATGVARRFHLPELLIGATVVSIGTTLPEVMVSVQGAASGAGGVAYGNAIGSVICNTALIAALSIAVRPSKVDRRSMITPICFFAAAAVIFCISAYIMGDFPRWIGLILLTMFAIYMAVTFLSAKKAPSETSFVESDEAHAPITVKKLIIDGVFVLISGGFMLYKGELMGGFGIAVMAVYVVYAVYTGLCMRAKKASPTIVRDLLFLIIGAGMIAGGADLLVDSGIVIAKEVGVPETVIALTFMALGTSLPELVTTVTSLVKGHGALSLGNIIGANLFNLVLVGGASISIAPFKVPADKLIGGINSSLIIDIPVMLSVMGIMVIPALLKGKLSRWQGFLLFGIYGAFCVLQFVL